MAKLQFRPQFLILFVTLFSSSSVFSRALEKIPKTSVLDVSASIKKTHEILSFDPKTIQQQQQQTQSTSSSSFTVLSLYSRDTLHKSPHTDYKSLTLSRLQRDSARINSLHKKLNLPIIKGNKSSDQFKPLDIESPINSGISQGSGEYFTRFGIGTPSKLLYTAIDTGSDVTWVQCTPCTDCYKQTDPIFNPSTSSSYKTLPCNSLQCKQLDTSGCTSNTCLYQVSYGDGSFTTGDFVTETLTFGSSAVNNIAIGCGHDNEGLFIGSAGLLALGRGSVSFPSQIKTPSFSYCLVDKDSTSASTLEFGSLAAPSDAVLAPLLLNRQKSTFYYVELTGLSVGGQLLPISPSLFEIGPSGNGGVIVDSGTAVTRFRTEAYNELRDAFVKGVKGLPPAGSISLFDTCYDLSSRTSVEVPTVGFHFAGGKSLNLPAKNYLIPVEGRIFCFAFAPMSASVSIIGNIQQQGIRVSFDVGKSVIGFSSNKC